MTRCAAHNYEADACGRCSEERKRAKELAERRERIATAALKGLLSGAGLKDGLSVALETAELQAEGWARDARILAEALIAEIDKPAPEHQIDTEAAS